MRLFLTAWDFLGACLVFFFGLILMVKLAKRFSVRSRRAVVLYIWHSLLCIVYASYVISNGGDAVVYFESSLIPDIDFAVGTHAVIGLTRVFSYYLDLSLLGVFFVFNIFGALGLLAFDGAVRQASVEKSKEVRLMATLAVFLPSVSFWSAGIGKDALSFMSVGLALWAALNFDRRARLMVFSVLVMFLVRPHVAAIMLVAILGSLMLRRGVSKMTRFSLIFVSLGVAAFLVPFALKYAGLEDASDAEDLGAYVQQRQGYNQEGGGGVDIAGMSFPVKLFTYLFRPLPFEAHSIFSLAASVDNIFLLILCAAGIKAALSSKGVGRIPSQENRFFLWSYSIITWIVLASTTANLGISVRQKWMFVPLLIFLFISMMRNKTSGIGRSSAPL